MYRGLGTVYLQAKSSREMRRSTGQSNTCYTIAGTNLRYWISLPTVMTSGSIAPQASICRSGASCEPQMDVIPNTTLLADDLNFVTSSSLGESFHQLLNIIKVLEENFHYLNLNPKCEPQLGRRGLYRQMGGIKDAAAAEMAILWTLNLSDGGHDLLDIAFRSGVPFAQISRAADALRKAKLGR